MCSLVFSTPAEGTRFLGKHWVPVRLGLYADGAVVFGAVFKLELCKWWSGELGLAQGHFQPSLKFPFCGA